MSINLNSITFQSGLRSKPVRENFTDIMNAVNAQDASISALTTAASGSETVAARDYHTDLKDRLRSTSKGVGSVIITGGAVTEQGTPDMTVAVAAGEALVNGVACKWAAADSGTITAPVTHPRIDVVVINSDNTLSIVAGSEAATPVKPTIAVSQRPLATITLATSTTSITTSLITDWRYKGGIVQGVWYYDSGVSKKQIFTSSGTWTRPSNVDYVEVLCVGAGGAGGDAVESAGGGGGGAGAVRKSIIAVSGNVTVTVGATGNTSFGTFTANAGSDGADAVSNVSAGNGGAGGGFGAGGGGGGGGGGASSGGNGGAGGNYGVAGTNGGDGGGIGSETGGTGGATTGSGGFGAFTAGTGGTLALGTGVYYGGGGGGASGYAGDGGDGGDANGAISGDGENGYAGEGYGAGGGGGAPGEIGKGTGGAGGAGLCIVEWIE